MQIETLIAQVRDQLELAAQTGDEEARAAAQRLIAPLEASVRLAIQDALAAASEEITLELAPGAVELRLRGREPSFVVTLPPTGLEGTEEGIPEAPPVVPGGDDENVSRISLRLPVGLKASVERAAAAEGLSVNTWLVRAASSAVGMGDPSRPVRHRVPQGGQRLTGWAR